MSRVKFKIRSKPKRPVRNPNFKQWLGDVESDDTLLKIVEMSKGLDPKYICIEKSYGYYDEVSIELVYSGPEPDENLEKRIENYNSALADYKKWYVENQEAIEIELAFRKKEEEDQKHKECLELKIKLEKKKKQIERKLNSLGV